MNKWRLFPPPSVPLSAQSLLLGYMRDDPTKHHPPSSHSSRGPAARPARKKIAPLAEPERKTRTEAPAVAAGPQRIAKVIARAGACSRRDAEAWISEGRVALNGVVLASPAVNVGDDDEITIDGAPLAQRAPTRLFLFHKPRGLVTTERDPEGRQTIFDYLREHWPDAPRLVSIGRLDINTEGLLLLTNDGGLARVLELPSTGWVRRYRVRAKGSTDQAVLDQLRHGVTIDGVNYAEIEAKLDRVQGANSWLTMGLREGKNREVKRVLEHLGLEVNRLIRLSFGPFQLADLPEGGFEEIRTRVLRDQLGPALAEAAGVDFAGAAAEPDAPVESPRGKPARAARQSDDGARRAPPDRPMRRGERQPLVLSPRPEARKKPAPAPRKHISALREDGAEPGSARKRIERSETADRSGRTVPVERLVPVERAARGKAKARFEERKGENPPPNTRNSRRFEAERQQRHGVSERPMRGPGRVRAPFEAKEHRATTDAAAARPQRRAEGGAPAAKVRRPYDGDKDRSRTDARPARSAAAKRSGEPYRGTKTSGARTDSRPADRGAAKRFGGAPGKAQGQRTPGARTGAPSDKRKRGAQPETPPSGAASHFRGKDQGPGGRGGKPSFGGKRPGKPTGASRGTGDAGKGRPGKGRPRGKP